MPHNQQSFQATPFFSARVLVWREAFMVASPLSLCKVSFYHCSCIRQLCL